VRKGAPRGGFSALVPIPNGGGRHRAAPFGLGPWAGARVAPQQGPTLRPGQRYSRCPEGAVEPGTTERRLMGPRCGPVVRSELFYGSSRSLPFGPTRDVSWMRRPGPLRARVSGTMLWSEWPGRRGIRTRQIRVCRGRGPGGATHGCRGRYLAKGCVGSNRLDKNDCNFPWRSDDNRLGARRPGGGKSAGIPAPGAPREKERSARRSRYEATQREATSA
jgi:hypothetical protein